MLQVGVFCIVSVLLLKVNVLRTPPSATGRSNVTVFS